MQLSKSSKIITFGHKKVESMRLESLQENAEVPSLPFSKTDLLFNLKFFQDCLVEGKDVQGQFHSSRAIAKDSLQANFASKKNFSKQKKVKNQLQRSKSQQLDKTGEHTVAARGETHSRKSDEVHGKFVPEGMHIDNLMNYISEDPAHTLSHQNRLDPNELAKINEIVRIHSQSKPKSKSKSKRKRKRKSRAKLRQPKPSIDMKLDSVASPKSFEIAEEVEKTEEIKFNCPKESFKLISNEQMKEDIQRGADVATSIRDSHSRLKLDFSDIEEGSSDSLVNPLDGILDDQFSLGSAQEKEKKSESGKEEPSGNEKEESMSEDDEMDFADPNFKFVEYLETKTRKLYTKREIKANISWSSTEHDIFNPEFTDEEDSAEDRKSGISDQFYLDKVDDCEEQSLLKTPIQFKLGSTLETLELTESGKNTQEPEPPKRQMKQFKVVISANGDSENWESQSFNNSLININDLSEQLGQSESSSLIKEKRESQKVQLEEKGGNEGPVKPAMHKMTKTQDFKEMLRMSDAGQGRKNKHFVSLKKIREKAKIGIEKKWGQFANRNIRKPIRKDSEVSGKEASFSRAPFTNRSIKSKKPLNASLNVPQLPKLAPIKRNNFSFHSRYKDDQRSVASTNQTGRRSRSKNTSLVRSRKKRPRSRKSSHCLKAGLFCVTSNMDNIYSVQNRRVTVDSADSAKSRHFFQREGHVQGLVTQAKNLNGVSTNVVSALSRKLSKRVTPENPSLFSSTHQERKKPFTFGFQIRGQFQTKFEKVGGSITPVGVQIREKFDGAPQKNEGQTAPPLPAKSQGQCVFAQNAARRRPRIVRLASTPKGPKRAPLPFDVEVEPVGRQSDWQLPAKTL